jgi:hypothetical protein
MAAIASGLNFSTLNEEGIALNQCNTLSSSTPEVPNLPFAFGARTIGLDGSTWIYAKPGGAYFVGTVGYLDTSWNFTAITETLAAANGGLMLAVMSQVASVTAAPSANQNSIPWAYDGVWVQTSGLCPAIAVAASTTANAQLYSAAADSARTITAMTGPTAVAGGNAYVITATSAPSYVVGSTVVLSGMTPSTLNGSYVVTVSAAGAAAFTAVSATASGTWSNTGSPRVTGTIQGVLASSGTTVLNGIVITTGNSTTAVVEPGVLNFPEILLTT